VALSCFVVAGASSMPYLPGLMLWPTLVLGEAANDSSMGLWSVAASSPPMRMTGGQQRGGMPICLINMANLEFLLCKDGDLPETGFYDLARVVISGRLRQQT
jgi:hypothetical protein